MKRSSKTLISSLRCRSEVLRKSRFDRNVMIIIRALRNVIFLSAVRRLRDGKCGSGRAQNRFRTFYDYDYYFFFFLSTRFGLRQTTTHDGIIRPCTTLVFIKYYVRDLCARYEKRNVYSLFYSFCDRKVVSTPVYLLQIRGSNTRSAQILPEILAGSLHDDERH